MNRVSVLYDFIGDDLRGDKKTWRLPSENFFKNYDYTFRDFSQSYRLFQENEIVDIYTSEGLPEFYLSMEVELSKKRAQLFDVNIFYGHLVLSEKALDILKEKDPMAHQIVPITITSPNIKISKKYFVVHPRRFIETKLKSKFIIPNFSEKMTDGYSYEVSNSDLLNQDGYEYILWKHPDDKNIIYMSERLIDAFAVSGCSGAGERTAKTNEKQGFVVNYV